MCYSRRSQSIFISSIGAQKWYLEGEEPRWWIANSLQINKPPQTWKISIG
jgi:hypothetical protein